MNSLLTLEIVGKETDDAPENGMAFDRLPTRNESVRSYDAFGRLHISRANISKAAINEYFGREVPDGDQLRLQPDRLYKFYRHPEELEKAASSFNNVPLLRRHAATSAEDHPHSEVIGATGTEATFSSPYLVNSLVVWKGENIAEVENDEKKQLSCGYNWRADMTPGVADGVRYDGVMRDIVGNHVAIVALGRAGPDVLIGDEQPHKEGEGSPPTERTDMAKIVLSRKAAMVHGAVLAHIQPQLASDALPDLTSAFAGVTSANFKASKGDIVTKVTNQLKDKLKGTGSLSTLSKFLGAFDEMDPEEEDKKDDKDKAKDKAAKDAEGEGGEFTQADVEEAYAHGYEDGLDDGEDKAEGARAHAEGEDKAAKDKAAKDKAAKDAGGAKDIKPGRDAWRAAAKDRKAAKDRAAKDAEMDKDKNKQAGDEAITKQALDEAVTSGAKAAEDRIRASMREAREAERFVRPWVGELAMAYDTGEAIYRAAAVALKIPDADKVHASALPTLIKMCPKPGDKSNGGRETHLTGDAATQLDSATAEFNTMFKDVRAPRVLG